MSLYLQGGSICRPDETVLSMMAIIVEVDELSVVLMSPVSGPLPPSADNGLFISSSEGSHLPILGKSPAEYSNKELLELLEIRGVKKKAKRQLAKQDAKRLIGSRPHKVRWMDPRPASSRNTRSKQRYTKFLATVSYQDQQQGL